ncbi:MAG TPA: 6-phosphofructokinase [Firmicutes bacterium]|jgi:hypothetical protein|nr:6-phosphofructokinase [Bacillota bacterium]HAW99870.1 6-phosphofructokinase [Bacillota bacterium]
MKNALYLQSGGPTAVINSSLYGVIKAYVNNTDKIGHLYGSLYGIEGVLKDNLVEIEPDLSKYDELKYMSGAILGSARLKLGLPEDDDRYVKIHEIAKKYDIGYILVNGGNDSMDTANKLNKFFAELKEDIVVMGIPKTIDNDLILTDHTPGFGSAVKFVTKSIMEIGLDINSYRKGRATIVEIMGRDAGWLAGATALGKLYNLGPDLIYLPEIPFDRKKFLDDVERVFKEKGHVLICASEALKDTNGEYVSVEDKLDSFGHKQLGSVSKYLEILINSILNINTRTIELSLLQRAGAHLASKIDRQEAIDVGEKALEYALQKRVGMVSIIRDSNNPYHSHYDLVPLASVANAVKTMPLEYVNKSGNGMTQEFIEYVYPFIDGDDIGIHSSDIFLSQDKYAKVNK